MHTRYSAIRPEGGHSCPGKSLHRSQNHGCVTTTAARKRSTDHHPERGLAASRAAFWGSGRGRVRFIGAHPSMNSIILARAGGRRVSCRRCQLDGLVSTVEAYQLTTKGGVTDFARVIAACESFGPYCLIGGLSLSTCYVDPVYTLDAEIVVEHHPHSVNLQSPGSELRIQFTTDERYQAFPARSKEAEVLGGYTESIRGGGMWQENFGPIPIQGGG